MQAIINSNWYYPSRSFDLTSPSERPGEVYTSMLLQITKQTF